MKCEVCLWWCSLALTAIDLQETWVCMMLMRIDTVPRLSAAPHSAVDIPSSYRATPTRRRLLGSVACGFSIVVDGLDVLGVVVK